MIAVMPTPKDKKRLTLDIEPTLHQRLKLLAVRLDRDMRDLIEEWIAPRVEAEEAKLAEAAKRGAKR